MATKNAINANSSGVVRYDGAGTWAASTLTQNGVLYGGASNAISSLAVAATGTVLTGTGGSPAFSATPSVTSITVNSGTALSQYVEGTFTSTIGGTGSDPTNGYSLQVGRYTRIGNRVIVMHNAILSSTSGGSGNVKLNTLPYTSANTATDENVGACYLSNVAYTASTFVVPDVANNVNYGLMVISAPSSAATNVTIAMLTSTSAFISTIIYEV